MQQHFFAAVRHGVGVALVAALADEVAFFVVARKEGKQMVVNRRFTRRPAFLRDGDFTF